MTDHGDLTEFLTDRERGLMAAWTLPNDGPLSDAQRSAALENFRNYIRRHGITANLVGHQLGTPKATTIGDLLKGVYRENADAHVRTLNHWVEQHARKQAVQVKTKYVQTRVAKDMMQVAKLVRENTTMGIVYGPTGIGKTRCAEAIAATFVGAIYIRLTHERRTPRGLITVLAKELACLDQSRKRTGEAGYVQSRTERVIERLRGSSRLLIIDEAHQATNETLEVLRDLYDVAAVPILLVATKDLHDRIQKTIDPDHGQQNSRVNISHYLTEDRDVSVQGGKPLFTVKDIRELYEQPPVRLAHDAVDYLLEIANELGCGSLRRCNLLVINGVRRARKRQELDDFAEVTVTADDLDYVESLLAKTAGEREAIAERRRRAATIAASA